MCYVPRLFTSLHYYLKLNSCLMWFIFVIFCTPNSMLFLRSVYHCPFCNLCRLGSGLGTDFFHCMKCNCCLGIKMIEHKCREKMLEMNCPICCDFLFTSSAPVKGFPCGHFMHSACFQVWQSSSILICYYGWGKFCSNSNRFDFTISGIYLYPLHLSNLMQILGRYDSKLRYLIVELFCIHHFGLLCHW